MRRAVFLDRDGVINHSIVREGRPFAPTSQEEFVIIDGGLQQLPFESGRERHQVDW